MPNVQIQQLYEYERFPESRVNVLTLVLYFPFGILLFLLRLVFVFLPVYIATFILNDAPFVEQILRRLLYIALGITSKVEKSEKLNRGAIYISNYASPFDHLVLISEAECQGVSKKKFRPLLAKVFGTNGPTINPNNLESTRKEINDYLSYEQKSSLLIQPEGKMTNGMTLIKFKLWPFNVCTKVYPVVIKINRPIVNCSLSTITSNIWSDAFYYMFSLKTEYKVKVLPPVEKKGMTDDEFAEEVRKQMAAALKVSLVDYTASDLEEYEKRYLADLERNSASQHHSSSGGNAVAQPSPLMQTMAHQVKDILPLVPLKVIYKDLVKTRSVDLTVANILDGHVFYIPETQPASSSSMSPSAVKASSSVNFLPSSSPSTSKETVVLSQSISPSSFGKSASDRMKSFQERKNQLIENARKRYIEKHGLENSLKD
ncbi:ancient ubiquitous protein 1 [Agrilus planipennis]|uniref:Ancient ubiquitous protein 1 n=1 Tax=Agrilus planipennis TaxID=224129 RepID=A0A1W4WMY8_AGRPL|nr:ancient ubiquitous protein 1 [Agrilus planipennis]